MIMMCRNLQWVRILLTPSVNILTWQRKITSLALTVTAMENGLVVVVAVVLAVVVVVVM